MDKELLQYLENTPDKIGLHTDSNKVELIKHGTPLFHISVHYTQMQYNNTLALYHHLHEELELFFLLKGKLRFHTPGQVYKLIQGDLVLIKPNTLHSAFKPLSESVEFIAITIHKEFLSSQLNDRIQQEFISPLFSDSDTIKSYYSSDFCIQNQLDKDLAYISEHYTTKTYGYELLIKAKLYELVYKIISPYPPSLSNKGSNLNASLRLQKSIEYIQNHYQEKILLLELAKLSSMSEGHFGRLFRSYYGITVIDYINDYRLNMAAYRLSNKNASITEIAHETGFTNLSYFTKCFKKTFGSTPKDYRKNSKMFE